MFVPAWYKLVYILMLYYIEQLLTDDDSKWLDGEVFYRYIHGEKRYYKYGVKRNHWFHNYPPNKYCLCCGTEIW